MPKPLSHLLECKKCAQCCQGELIGLEEGEVCGALGKNKLCTERPPCKTPAHRELGCSIYPFLIRPGEFGKGGQKIVLDAQCTAVKKLRNAGTASLTPAQIRENEFLREAYGALVSAKELSHLAS